MIVQLGVTESCTPQSPWRWWWHQLSLRDFLLTAAESSLFSSFLQALTVEHPPPFLILLFLGFLYSFLSVWPLFLITSSAAALPLNLSITPTPSLFCPLSKAKGWSTRSTSFGFGQKWYCIPDVPLGGCVTRSFTQPLRASVSATVSKQ